MKRIDFLFLILSTVLSFFSCTEYEDVGSDLLDGEEIVIGKITDLNYRASTQTQDSLIVYSRFGRESDFIPVSHILGQIDDPIFGKAAYDLTAQLAFTTLGLDFAGAELDSVVLLLSYDTTFQPYGSVGEHQMVEVLELSSRDLPERIFVSDSYSTKPEILGQHEVRINYNLPVLPDSIAVPPHIRIPLSEEFGNRILAMDTVVTSSSIQFLEAIPGIVIRPVENQFSGLFRIYAYASGSSGPQSDTKINQYSGIRIYYTQDGEAKEAMLRMQSQFHHFTTIRTDYEGSTVGEVLNSTEEQPSYVYIQPAGLGVKLKFDDLSVFRNKVINNVELRWNVAELPMDDTIVYRPLETVFSMANNMGVMVPISDILINQTSGAYQQFFGGLLEKNTSGSGSNRQYRFNITNQFQYMVNGIADPEIMITTTPQNVNRVGRTVLYGPGVSDAALRPVITVTYSNSNNR